MLLYGCLEYDVEKYNINSPMHARVPIFMRFLDGAVKWFALFASARIVNRWWL